MSRNFPGGATGNHLSRTVPFTSLANFTFSFWIKLDGNQGSNVIALLFGNNSSPGRGVAVGFQTAGGTTIQIADSFVAWRGSGSVLGSTAWRHVAVTRTSSGNYSLYVDGSLIETATAAPSAVSGSDKVGLGGCPDGGANGVDGSVCELAIWDTPLALAEIAALAKGASPLSVRPGPKLYVPTWAAGSPEPDAAVGGSWTLSGTGTLANHAPVGPSTPGAS